MRKGLIVLILLLVFVFGLIGLQQENASQSSQTVIEETIQFSNN